VRTGGPGSFAAGLAQTLGVWLLALAGFVSVHYTGVHGPAWPAPVTVLWLACGAGLTGCVMLYAWHRLRTRDRTAAGVRTGALSWPAAIVLVTMTVSVVSMSISE
jgi:hypothetical protein